MMGVDPDKPVSRAARRAIESRLEVVESYLPLAAKQSHRDVEYVHQLRVAARRAGAAVDLYGPWLPPKRRRWLKRQLRRIRRAAGEARDLDVMQQRLAESISQCDAAVIALLGEIETRRRRAQRPLRKIHRRMKKRRFGRRWRRLVRRIRPRGNPAEARRAFGPWAHAALASAVADFFSEAEQLDASSLQAMHRFRIAGKRLRYTIELLAVALDDSLRRTAYPMVEQLQDHLGDLRDHIAAAAFLESALHESDKTAWRDRLAELHQCERHAAEESRQRFVRWWNEGAKEELRRCFDELIDLPSHERKTA